MNSLSEECVISFNVGEIQDELTKGGHRIVTVTMELAVNKPVIDFLKLISTRNNDALEFLKVVRTIEHMDDEGGEPG